MATSVSPTVILSTVPNADRHPERSRRACPSSCTGAKRGNLSSCVAAADPSSCVADWQDSPFRRASRRSADLVADASALSLRKPIPHFHAKPHSHCHLERSEGSPGPAGPVSPRWRENPHRSGYDAGYPGIAERSPAIVSHGKTYGLRTTGRHPCAQGRLSLRANSGLPLRMMRCARTTIAGRSTQHDEEE